MSAFESAYCSLSVSIAFTLHDKSHKSMSHRVKMVVIDLIHNSIPLVSCFLDVMF